MAIYDGDPNEVVVLGQEGISVRRGVLQAIRLLWNGFPEVGVPFINGMVEQLGSWNEMALFLDKPNHVGVSPAEYILRGSQSTASKMLEEHLQARNTQV